jgi:hypothetical protein
LRDKQLAQSQDTSANPAGSIKLDPAFFFSKDETDDG